MGFIQSTITKMAEKMSAAYQFCCCCHSNLVIFDQIDFNLHICIACIKRWFKFEYGFCPTTITKMADKNGRCLSICFCGQYLNYFLPDCFQISYMDYFYQTFTHLIIYYLIASKFHIWITFFKLSPKLEHWFCLTNDQQDGH